MVKRRLPWVAIIALVIAVTAVIYLQVKWRAFLVLQPMRPYGGVFTVAEGTYYVYYHSDDTITVTSNVTADFGVVFIAPVFGFYPSLPPGVRFRINFTDPVGGQYDLVVYNDSGVVRVVYYAAPCVLNAAYIVSRLPNYVFAYPDVSQYIAAANDNGIVWYTQDGQVAAVCKYARKYTSTTGYSFGTPTQLFTFTLSGGETVIIAVRPVVAGAVKPSATAKIIINP